MSTAENNPSRSFSFWRVLLSGVVLGAICVGIFKWAESGIRERSEKESERSAAHWFRLTAPMLRTLDPRFTGVYEFAAVVLPAVDVEAAVMLLEKGIRANPEEWYLHQQLAYIFWQRGDNLAAADAFRRGSRMTTARWMVYMAEKLEAKGDDPDVARAMYARMYEQAQDEQVRQWAQRRLMELRSLQERSAIRRALAAHVAAHGQCPRAWTELAAALAAGGVPTSPQGLPLDPTGTPYLLVLTPLGCDVTLHPLSTVPRG